MCDQQNKQSVTHMLEFVSTHGFLSHGEGVSFTLDM